MSEKTVKIWTKKALNVVKNWTIVLALILVWGVLSILSPHFLQWSNISNILLQSSNIMMCAIGMTFILIGGQMDLSIGSVEALSGTICALMIVNIGLPFLPSVIIACCVGMCCGLVSGTLVSRFKFPPFIATLSMQGIARGAALVICKGAAILVPNETFKSFGRDDLFGFLPIPVVVAGCFLILAHIILTYTRFGTNVYALGSNEIAAQLSGINVNRTKTLVFMLSGFTAAVGGLIMSARLGSGQSTMGELDVMDTVASVVIGGTSMRGGVGKIRGTLVGVLIITTIRNGLNLMHVNSYWQQVAIGLLIIIAVMIDQVSKGELKKK